MISLSFFHTLQNLNKQKFILNCIWKKIKFNIEILKANDILKVYLSVFQQIRVPY